MRSSLGLHTAGQLLMAASALFPSMAQPHFTEQSAVAGLQTINISGSPQDKQYILEARGSGAAFFDCDNDGDLDLFVANGHVFPQVDDAATGTSYRQRNQLFRNDLINGSAMFIDISHAAGPGMAIEKVSRGVAFADYDDDGDVDVFVVNLNDTPSLLRNDGRRQQLARRGSGRG